MLKRALREIFRRRKLWKICRVLKLSPYPWQRAFALGYGTSADFPEGRCTGKTTAVMLRLLMMTKKEESEKWFVGKILSADPDWWPRDRHRTDWYHSHYNRLCRLCYQNDIYVPYLCKADFVRINF